MTLVVAALSNDVCQSFVNEVICGGGGGGVSVEKELLGCCCGDVCQPFLKSHPPGGRGGGGAPLRDEAGAVQASQLGRVIQFDPATGKSKVLGSKLWFASGVALSPNEDFLLVSEAFGVSRGSWPTTCMT